VERSAAQSIVELEDRATVLVHVEKSAGAAGAAVVVAENIFALPLRHRAVIDISAGDRMPIAVGVFGDGSDGGEAVGNGSAGDGVDPCAFHESPAIVSTGSDDVHFFALVLADIADIELAGGMIEIDAEWIAQPVCEDFVD